MRKIKKDLFNIAYRLKKIDKGYFIIFNTLKNRYEVHNKNQSKNTLCFCCDRKYLTAEVVSKAHITNIRNSKRLLKDIELNNISLQKKQEDGFKDKYMQDFKSFLDYANNKNCECDFSNFNLTKWL